MHNTIPYYLTIFLSFFYITFATTTFAQNKKPHSSTEIVVAMQAKLVANEKLIVKWKEKPNLLQLSQLFAIKNHSYLFQQPQISIAEQNIAQTIGIENIAQLEISQQDIPNFMEYAHKNQLVHYIEPIAYAKTNSIYNPNDPLTYSQWGLEKAKVYEAWDISKGSPNVKIGIIDTGILPTHADLKGNFAYNEAEKNGLPNVDDDKNGFVDDSLGYDFGNNDANVLGETQHGTQVAGIAAASTNNGIGIAGVGFMCKLLPIKVVSDFVYGQILTIEIYKGIKYAADQGCQVINVSMSNVDGAGIYNLQYYQYQQDIINYATLVKKSLVVAAAGNSNSNQAIESFLYPSSYQNVLSVAASDIFDKRMLLGVYNNLVDITAPGVDIQSTIGNGGYDNRLTGSSFAAPFVSGAAGLLKAKYPELTGLQIGELLRVTADNIYNISENTVWKDKLGTGRINVLNALNKRNSAIAVRYQNLSYQNKLGKYAFAGDSLTIMMSFVNLLNTVKNLQVEIEAMSADITISQNSFWIGNLATLDTTSNQHKPFKIYIANSVQPSTNLIFKLKFTGDNYTDTQYFILPIQEETLTLERNDLTISTAANGRLGCTDETNKQGKGILFKNTTLLKEAGLMLATNNRQVPNAVLSLPNKKSNHFRTITHAKWEEIALQRSSISSVFSDDNAGNMKIGLQINQKITARINTPHQQYLQIQYTIQNRSNAKIDSLSVGIFADFNIDIATANRAKWDDSLKIAYTHNTANYVGIKVFGGNSYHCLSFDKLNNTENPTNFSVQDSFSSAEKFFAMNNNLRHTNAGISGNGSDVAQVIATKIALERGESKIVTFVLMAGNSLQNLQTLATEAAKYINPNTQSPIPIQSPYICKDNLLIEPKNGTNFRFYTPENLSVPIKIGRNLAVNAADTAKTYFISNVDSVRESELLAYQFKIRTAKAIAVFKDSLNIFDSTKVAFYSYSPFAVRQVWSFGDGTATSTDRNPVHSYTRAGIYTVKLTITDSLGCIASSEYRMKVVRLARSPLPIVPTTVKVCAKESVLISPMNGKKFNFYVDSLATKFLGQGQTYVVKDISLTKIYVSNVDSVIESPLVRIWIDRPLLDAKFLPSAKADTILFAEVTFSDKTISKFPIVAWEWNFGDGKGRSIQQNPIYLYDKQGIYRVKLKVWDTQGCSDTLSKIFKVGKKSPLPLVPATITSCPNTLLRIAPQKGSNFYFYADEHLSEVLAVGNFYDFYPYQSQKIYVVCTDSLVESEPVAITVAISKPEIKINIPKTIKLYENPSFQPSAEHESVLYWLWNFGDGSTSTEAKPIHTYQKQGTYAIKLQTTDRYGCTQTFLEYINVLNRAEKPIIASQSVCKNQKLVLSPSGGKVFNFYDQMPNQNISPLQSSATFTIDAVDKDMIFYVTCIDSLLESLPTMVKITTKTIEVDFLMNKDTINIYEKDTLWLQAKDTQALAYQWSIEGKTKNGVKNYFTFEQAGEYTVSLKLTANNACIGIVSKKIVVIYQDISKLPPYTKLDLYPNPSKNGNITMDLSLRKPNYVTISVYNSIGQVINSYSEDYFKDKTYKFDFKNFATGLYLLKIKIGERQVVEKIMIE
jgi:subtilisin family serine protease/PKD repeat protein